VNIKTKIDGYSTYGSSYISPGMPHKCDSNTYTQRGHSLQMSQLYTHVATILIAALPLFPIQAELHQGLLCILCMPHKI
jgi:hypothetical protein